MLLLNENMITFLSEAFCSSIFVVTLLGIGAGLYVFLSKIKSLVFFNWVDVFVSVVALGYYFFHFSVSNLWTMGTFSLLLIYWAIRLIPGCLMAFCISGYWRVLLYWHLPAICNMPELFRRIILILR